MLPQAPRLPRLIRVAVAWGLRRGTQGFVVMFDTEMTGLLAAEEPKWWDGAGGTSSCVHGPLIW